MEGSEEEEKSLEGVIDCMRRNLVVRTIASTASLVRLEELGKSREASAGLDEDFKMVGPRKMRFRGGTVVG